MMVRTFVPHAAGHNEHGEGEDGSNDSATHIGRFSIFLRNCELPCVDDFLVKHSNILNKIY